MAIKDGNVAAGKGQYEGGTRQKRIGDAIEWELMKEGGKQVVTVGKRDEKMEGAK